MTNEEKREALRELLYSLLYVLGVDLEEEESKYVEDSANSIMEVFECE